MICTNLAHTELNSIYMENYFAKQFLCSESRGSASPIDFQKKKERKKKNKGLIPPAGKFCKIILQVFQQNLPTQLKPRLPHTLLCGKGPQWDRLPVTQMRAKLFSRFEKWTDVLLGWWRQAPPHTFSLDVLTNIPSQLFWGDQQLMNAKAGAGVITHSSHTTTNSCQSAKFLSGSKSRRVHCGEFGLWMCSPRPIWEHLKLIMMWSLCMNKYKKIIQTLRRRHTSKHERMDIT